MRCVNSPDVTGHKAIGGCVYSFVTGEHYALLGRVNTLDVAGGQEALVRCV